MLVLWRVTIHVSAKFHHRSSDESVFHGISPSSGTCTGSIGIQIHHGQHPVTLETFSQLYFVAITLWGPVVKPILYLDPGKKPLWERSMFFFRISCVP